MSWQSILQVFRPGGITSASGTPNFLVDLESDTYQAQFQDLQQGGLGNAVFLMRKTYEDVTDIIFGNWLLFALGGGTLSSVGTAGATTISVANLPSTNVRDNNGNPVMDIVAGDNFLISDGVNTEQFVASSVSGSSNPYTITLGAAPGIGNTTLKNTYGIGAKVCRLVFQGRILSRIHNTQLDNQFQINAQGFFARYGEVLTSASTIPPATKDAGSWIYETLNTYSGTLPEILVNSANFSTNTLPVMLAEDHARVSQFIADVLKQEDAVQNETGSDSGGGSLYNPTQIVFSDPSDAPQSIGLRVTSRLVDHVVVVSSDPSIATGASSWTLPDNPTLVNNIPITITPVAKGTCTITSTVYDVNDNILKTLTTKVTVKLATASTASRVYSVWVDATRQVYHKLVATAGTPTVTIDINTGGSTGDVLGPLETTDMDGSNLLNAVYCRGGSDSNGNTVECNVLDNYSRTLLQSGALADPLSQPAPAKSSTGGTLAADTYTYCYTAKDSSGNSTLPSPTCQVQTTGSTSKVTLTLPAISGAASYDIYRTDASHTTPQLYDNAATTTYTDTGAGSYSASGVPATNTTGAGGWFEGTLDNSDINDQDQLANWAAGQLAIMAYPRTAAKLTLSSASLRITGRDLVSITGFSDGSSLLINPIEVDYVIDAQAQSATGTISMGVMKPDARVFANAAAQQHAIREKYNQNPTNLWGNFIVSGLKFTQGSGTAFSVSAGWVHYGGSMYYIPAYSGNAPNSGTSKWGAQVGGTPPVGTTLPEFVRMPHAQATGTQHSANVYTIGYRGGPPNKQTDFQGLPIYSVTTSNGAIVGYKLLATTGGSGGNNLKPPTDGTPGVSSVLVTASPDGMSNAMVSLSFTVTGVTLDDTIKSIDLVRAHAGTGNWGMPFVASWAPGNPNVVAYDHAVAANQAYDYGLIIRGQNGNALNASPVLISANGASPSISALAVNSAILTYNEFGGTLLSNGSLTAVDGLSTLVTFKPAIQYTLLAKGTIVRGGAGTSGIIIGNKTNGYGIEFDGTNWYIRKWKTGTQSNLAGPFALSSDLKPHGYTIGVSFTTAGEYDIEAGIGGNTQGATDKSPASALIGVDTAAMVETAGSTGTLRHWKYTELHEIFVTVPPPVATIVRAPWNGADAGGRWMQSGVVATNHMAGSSGTDTGAVFGSDNKVLHARHSAGVQAAIDSSGNQLNLEFVGGKEQADGSWTNVDGLSSATQYTLSAGQPITISADIARGQGTSSGFTRLILGNTTNGYAIYTDGLGKWYLFKFVNGVASNVSGTINTGVVDTNYHPYRMTVTPGSPNTIEISYDGYGPFRTTDSSLTLTTGSWPISLNTAGSAGKVQHYIVSAAPFHRTGVHTDYQTTVNVGGGIDLSSSKHINLLPLAKHGKEITDVISTNSGNGKVNVNPAGGVTGNLPLVNHDATVQTGSARANAAIDSGNIVVASGIDFSRSYTNQGALSRKNQASLTTDVTGTLPRANTDPSFTTAIGADSGLLNIEFVTTPGGSITQGELTPAGYVTGIDNAWTGTQFDSSTHKRLTLDMVVAKGATNAWSGFWIGGSGGPTSGTGFLCVLGKTGNVVIFPYLSGTAQSAVANVTFGNDTEWHNIGLTFQIVSPSNFNIELCIDGTTTGVVNSTGVITFSGAYYVQVYTGGSTGQVRYYDVGIGPTNYLEHPAQITSVISPTLNGGSYLQSGVVNTTHIVNGAVGTTQIANGAVNDAEIGTVKVDTLTDSTNYARVSTSSLTSNNVDLAKSGVAGKVMTNIADDTRSAILTTETAGAAGSRTIAQLNDGTRVRTAQAVATAIDASGNSLIHEFSQGSSNAIEKPDSSLTGVDGVPANTAYQVAGSAQNITASAQFQKGGSAICGFYIGSQNGTAGTGFFAGLSSDGAGNITIIQYVGGVPTSLESTASSWASDRNWHGITVTVTLTSPRVIEVCVDNVRLSATATQTFAGSMYVVPYTGGSAGFLKDYNVECTTQTHASLPSSVTSTLDTNGNVLSTTGFNANIPNTTAYFTDFMLHFSISSGSAPYTFTYWYDNGTSGQDAKIYVPSDASGNSDVNLGHSTSSAYSGQVTGIASLSAVVYVMAYHQGGSMHFSAQTSAFSASQIRTAYRDGGYVAMLASFKGGSGAYTLSNYGAGGSGSGSANGGRSLN